MEPRVIFEVRTPRTGVETPEAMAQFLASLASIKSESSFLSKSEVSFTLEIAVIDQIIRFFITSPVSFQSFIESQLLSQYPKALINKLPKDYLEKVHQTEGVLKYGHLKLTSNFVYPLKTFRDFKDVDPLSSLLGMLSKLTAEDFALVQFVLVPTGSSWQSKGQKLVEKKPSSEESDPYNVGSYSKSIADKVSYPGLKVGVRILTKGPSSQILDLIAATFISFNNITGNSLILAYPSFWQKDALLKSIFSRSSQTIPGAQILNILEVATMYHYPGEKLANIKNIFWSKTIISDAPENLPVAEGLSDGEKHEINFFAKTDYKNKQTTFGIKRLDRRKHVYIIGKTGTGKSTLIANMAINDIRNGQGVCVIDPHGDLCETLLNFIPSYRVNDVVYLNPSDVGNPFHLNPLEVTGGQEKELIASGIVSIFHKLYGHSWGPRLEYILRNTLLTLLEVPNSTLVMVPEILTNAKMREKIVERLEDPVLKSFWVNEYNAATDKMQDEWISSILNKVGQFVASPRIRGIIGSPKSTIDLNKIMDEGKIVLLNLSQGRIGEDNSALLGAMIITKIQLAAMNRVNIAESERKDFYLYVDEFQNFATTSFIKILSEARKYRLNLILANQYIDQIIPELRSAIFGNAGTIVTFVIGAGDAPFMAKEYGERFKLEDLLSLGNFQVLMKMSIEGLTSSPFVAQTLPLPNSKTQSREKVLKVSKERYTKPFVEKNNSDAKLDDHNSKEKIPTHTLNSIELLRSTFNSH